MLAHMTSDGYRAFSAIRDEFRDLIRSWSADHPYLLETEERVRVKQGYDDYRVETPVVYNRALDDVEQAVEIKVILVADNPGKKEQLAANNRYLVGQSGKLAESWFRERLGIDFRREVVILNKTPVHTPKTAELALLSRNAGIHRERLGALLAGSQTAMADLAWRLYSALRTASASASPWPVLWVSGVGELRTGGLFEVYRDELCKRLAKTDVASKGGVWAFNHFSMNQFSIEIKKKAQAGRPLIEELERVGRENRRRVFGL